MNINDYIVSRSNYVIQKKHQDTDKGEIFERDIATIGGRPYYANNQAPVYNSGNFIITTSSDTPFQKPAQEIVWDTAPDGSENWTYEDVQEMTEEEDKSISIELNPDVYNLRNFAYYGSCVELIRGSLNHIVNIFPGELYGTDRTLTIYDKKNNDYISLGGNLTFVDNPFNINVYESGTNESFTYGDENYLKFLNYGDTASHYEFFQDDDAVEGIDFKVDYAVSESGRDPQCYLPFEKMGVLYISEAEGLNKRLVDIHVYMGENNNIICLSNKSNWHIRPKQEFYNLFKSRLSLFEKALMNDSTTPKYSSKFDVYKETEYGFEMQLQTFSFPLAEGGYNLGVMSPSYSNFVGRLISVADFYDEYFSDNLYRSMTHEAIKNFDWSYKRNYTDAEEDEYLDGGGRMQKYIRLIGREFDEIKLYIDGISNSSTVTYNKENNLPDYFLTDVVENEGWDYKHIIPSVLDGNGKFVTYEENITPYDTESISDIDCFGLEPIKTYTSMVSQTPSSINNLFSRLLILNSRYLWRKKGTLAGIEGLLSLFGLKNKSWVNKINDVHERLKPYEGSLLPDCECDIKTLAKYSTVDKNDWDYYVEEHVSVIDRPIDVDDELRTINSYHKLITYEEDLDSSNIPTDWRGLMVKEKDGKLYPYFGKDVVYDGNPYYQMNGGWLHKEKFFDADDNICNKEIFTETINKVKAVASLQKLVTLPYSLLNDGDVYYVNDLDSDYIVIGGMVYNLQKYPLEKTATDDQWYYFEVEVRNSSCVIGDKIYYDSLSFKEPVPKGYEYSEDEPYLDTVKPLISYQNGTYVKIFIEPDGNLSITDTNISSFSGKAILNSQVIKNETVTNYFKLINANNSTKVTFDGDDDSNSDLGWIQLTTDSVDYKQMMTVEDYYEGNNPHTSTYKSDLGFEYMDYFIHLFKYSYENDLFNWDTIQNSYCKDAEDIDNKLAKINNFGFHDLLDESAPCSYNHVRDSNNKIYAVKEDNEDNHRTVITSEDSDRIINLKLVEIYFKVDSKERLKYIDSIVLPYLSQMLPSTLIIKIKYVNSNGKPSNLS